MAVKRVEELLREHGGLLRLSKLPRNEYEVRVSQIHEGDADYITGRVRLGKPTEVYCVSYCITVAEGQGNQYNRETSQIQRAELLDAVREVGYGSGIDVLRAVLRDLDQAEAVIRNFQEQS